MEKTIQRRQLLRRNRRVRNAWIASVVSRFATGSTIRFVVARGQGIPAQQDSQKGDLSDYVQHEED